MAEEPFVNFEGTWKNQHQSILELSVVDGLVRGRFQSRVGEDGQTLWAEINGRILGDVITFHAGYPLRSCGVSTLPDHRHLDWTTSGRRRNRVYSYPLAARDRH